MRDLQCIIMFTTQTTSIKTIDTNEEKTHSIITNRSTGLVMLQCNIRHSMFTVIIDARQEATLRLQLGLNKRV